jgi:polyisoprenoid-binding protein YceI
MCPTLALVALLAGAAGPVRYAVVPEASAVTIKVGRSGLFKFAGHEHEVVAPALRGEVVGDPADLAGSSVSLAFDAAALRVTGRGEPPDDVPKVQAAMLGPKVLDAARFPEITFRSRSVAGRQTAPGVHELQVTGDFTLHGVTRPLTVSVHVEESGGRLVAKGRAAVRQTDHGIKPVSVAGVVNVKNQVEVEFSLTARVSP